MTRSDSLHHRLYRLKTTLVAVLAVVVGVGLLLLARQVAGRDEWAWLAFWPLGELGSVLFGAGVIGIAWDYFDSRDREARETARLRRVLAEAAPELRDAVIDGFAVHPEDLRRVATPELLDTVAANALGLRLGDAQFGRELYQDLRDQALRSPERWHDLTVSLRLSGIPERSTEGTPLFAVTVQCDYLVVPAHSVQRFACVSDRDEFYELVTEAPATFSWFMTPRPGCDARQREAFELLRFSVDGQERPVRRSTRRSGQSYRAVIGEEMVAAARPVRISYTLRTVTPQSGHRLFYEIDQPARGLRLSIDYSDTTISHMSVTDLVASTQKARISRLPIETSAKLLELGHDGWLLPKAGFAFVWTLESEEPRTQGSRPAGRHLVEV